VRKSPSLHGRKFTPTPKFLGKAEAYFVCNIGPNLQISLIWVSLVRGLRYELLGVIALKPNDQSSEGCAGIYCPATEFSNEIIDLWITVDLYAVEATALS
jgi:hypothetical protein